ncbi:MAG: Txe/YoeB family addiction module toxin [Parafannyhessea sp.]|uniref:Txe/YoeB family addiction module toxin n=1 Tax=Parafannyhessea sp. TaxID=2847324 RepID=UPI003EFF6211
MIISWNESSWDEYVYWQEQDKKTLKRINKLLKAITRGERMGKAEILRHRGPGICSVRIDDSNRLVYRVEGDELFVISCRGHYE